MENTSENFLAIEKKWTFKKGDIVTVTDAYIKTNESLIDESYLISKTQGIENQQQHDKFKEAEEESGTINPALMNDEEYKKYLSEVERFQTEQRDWAMERNVLRWFNITSTSFGIKKEKKKFFVGEILINSAPKHAGERWIAYIMNEDDNEYIPTYYLEKVEEISKDVSDLLYERTQPYKTLPIQITPSNLSVFKQENLEKITKVIEDYVQPEEIINEKPIKVNNELVELAQEKTEHAKTELEKTKTKLIDKIILKVINFVYSFTI